RHYEVGGVEGGGGDVHATGAIKYILATVRNAGTGDGTDNGGTLATTTIERHHEVGGVEGGGGDVLGRGSIEHSATVDPIDRGAGDSSYDGGAPVAVAAVPI